MKTALSTGSLYPMTPEDAALTAYEAGFRAIEIFVNCEYEWSDDYIDRMRALLEERGMYVHSIHPYLSGSESFLLFSEYGRRRRECVDYYKSCIASAARYGAHYFILHGPGRGSPVPVQNDLRRPSAGHRLRDEMQRTVHEPKGPEHPRDHHDPQHIDRAPGRPPQDQPQSHHHQGRHGGRQGHGQ